MSTRQTNKTVLLLLVVAMLIGCTPCEAEHKIGIAKPKSKTTIKSETAPKISGWMMERPEQWRWDMRIGHLKLYSDFFKQPGWESAVENHLKILKDYGFNGVGICMHHYRFGQIDQWPYLEKNVKIVCDIAHNLDIKVFAHHSANFVVKKALDKKIGIGDHTIGEMIQIDARTDTASQFSGLSVILCPNNPLFPTTYGRHVRGLLDAGVDGLMSDDLCFYPDPYACACKYCRKKFIEQGGIELPPAEDTTFWMNRDNPRFRQWLDFRNKSIAQHYRNCADIIKEYPRRIELFNCNSDPTGIWANVQRAWNLEEMAAAGLTVQYLEPFENTSSRYDYFRDWYHQATDMKVTRSVNKYTDMPIWAGWYVSGTMRYGTYFPTKQDAAKFRKGKPFANDFYLNGSDKNNGGPAQIPSKEHLDQALFTWGLNHMFGDELWICWSYHHFADLLKFDLKYPGLWKRKGSAANVALVFSGQTRNWYLDEVNVNAAVEVDVHIIDDIYGNCWRGWATTLLDNNVVYDALTDRDVSEGIADQYQLLIVPTMACMSKKQCDSIRKFVKRGGTLIATGETSLYDETGERLDDFQLKDLFGIKSFDTLKTASGRFEIKAKSGVEQIASMLSQMKPKGVIAPVTVTVKPQADINVVDDSGDLHPGILTSSYGKGRVFYCSLKPGLQGWIRQPERVTHERNPEWGGSDIGTSKWLGPRDEKYRKFLSACIDWGLAGQRRFALEPNIEGLILNAYKGGDNSTVVHIMNMTGVELPKETVYDFPLTTHFPKLPADMVSMVLGDIKANRALLISPDIEEPMALQITKKRGKTRVLIPSKRIERYGIVVLD